MLAELRLELEEKRQLLNEVLAGDQRVVDADIYDRNEAEFHVIDQLDSDKQNTVELMGVPLSPSDLKDIDPMAWQELLNDTLDAEFIEVGGSYILKYDEDIYNLQVLWIKEDIDSLEERIELLAQA